MKSALLMSVVSAALCASGVTATKEWVQRATNDVLVAANRYTDEHGGSASLTRVDATNIAVAVVSRDALPKADGVASRLTVEGEFVLRGLDDSVGTIQFDGNDADNYTDWLVGVPGFWLGTYRLRNTGHGNVETIAYTSDLPNLAPYAVAAAVASNALPRAEAAQTYATQTALTTGLAGRMSLTGSNGVDETWSLDYAGGWNIIEFQDSNWMFHGYSDSAYYANEVCMMTVAGSYDGATVSDDLDGKLRMRFFRSDDGQSNDVEGWSATMEDLSALATTVESYHLDRYYTLESRSSYQAAGNSVQYITLAAGATSLSITPPTAVSGRVSDWVVYLFPAANVTLSFASSAHWYASDTDGVKSAASGKITKFAFSEIGMNASTGKPQFSVIKTELQEIQ